MTDAGRTYPPQRAVNAWILFDWAAQPFFTLVTTFVFAPFFASALAADAASGQALWGYATAAAGLCIACLSPVLGAIADKGGGRKPWIAVFGALLVMGSAMLWFAVPGAAHAVPIALFGYTVALIGAEFATVFNNAMMPTLVPPERIGRLSGTGWAVGYLGGLVSLALTLGLLAASPETGLTLAGLAPAFGLDAASRAGDRASGPLSALWFLVFVLPMFLLTPDRARAMPLGQAVGAGLSELTATLRSLLTPGRRSLATFLLANMIYADALAALFAFGGIYAAGVFGWSAIEIGIFGILLTVTGTLGAFIGGRLDDRIGSRVVIAGSLVVLMATCLGIMGTTRTSILYLWTVAPPPGGLFAGASEKAYVALGLMIGLVAGPLQAASRSMLVRTAPADAIGQYFGLFALSGKVTSFAGPLLVAVATQVVGTQQAGLGVLFVMFGAGLVVLSRMR